MYTIICLITKADQNETKYLIVYVQTVDIDSQPYIFFSIPEDRNNPILLNILNQYSLKQNTSRNIQYKTEPYSVQQ